MSEFTVLREPPSSRCRYCDGDKECYLPEAAVMIAFALHLLEKKATAVLLYPDGEHGKRFDIKKCLEEHGFNLTTPKGITSYGGVYSRGSQTVTVILRPGLGDVVADVDGRMLIAECKGGVLNSRHPGLASKLRQGLCEAVGLLMARSIDNERHVAVVVETDLTTKLGLKMLPRAQKAGIEIALVDGSGCATFLNSLNVS